MAKPKYDPTLVGYARVSTEEQSLEMQTDALEAAGVHPDRIHCEKRSGVAKKKPGRELAVKACREGDTFVVWKLDRVSRSVLDLLTFIERLKERGVGFRSLREQIDTETPTGKAMMALSSVFAQLERDLIQERTQAGVDRAKANGVRFGQPPKVTPEVERSMEAMFRDGATVREVAQAHKVTATTVYTYFNANRRAELRPDKP